MPPYFICLPVDCKSLVPYKSFVIFLLSDYLTWKTTARETDMLGNK